MNTNIISSLIIISILISFPISQSYAALLPFSGGGILSNTISRVVTSNGTVYSYNYSYPLNMVGQAGLTVTGSNKSGTIYLTAPAGVLPPSKTCSNGYGFYKYNQTSNTFSCSNFVGVNSTDAVTSLNALTGAITISGTSGNTTATIVGNTITINTAYNMVTTGLSAQTISKQLTLNNLVLGGNANGNSQSFTSLNQVNATVFYQNGNKVIDTLQANTPISVSQNHGNSITISCSTCSTSSGTITGSQNIGHGTGSFGVLGTATSTTIKGKNMTAGTGISLAGNTTDITINSLITQGFTTLQNIGKGGFGPLRISGTIIQSKNITCGVGMSCSSNSTDIRINATSSGGITSINGNTGPAITIDNTTINGNTGQKFTINNVTLNGNLGQKFTIDNVTLNTLTGQSFSLNRGPVTNMSTITNSSHTISYQLKNDIVLTNGSSQNVTKVLDFSAINIWHYLSDPSATKGAIWLSSTTNDTLKYSDAHSILSVAALQLAQTFTKINTFSVNQVWTPIADLAASTGEIWFSSTTNDTLKYSDAHTVYSITANNLASTFNSVKTFSSIPIFSVGTTWTPIADITTADTVWKSSSTSDVLKYENHAGTVTYDILSNISTSNSTTGQLSGNGTGSSSQTLKMDGVYATLTPENTGRVTVHVTGAETSATAGDGCIIQIRESTSNMGANGGALSGALIGTALHFKAAVASDPVGWARTVEFSGSPATKYFFDLGFAATGAAVTCTITDVNWDLIEH